LALPPQALILQSGTDLLKVLLEVNPFDSFHTWRESTDPTSAKPLDHYTRINSQLTALKKDADRLLDNLTAANRDFVDEKLIGIRSRIRDLEACQQELESVADGPLDIEAATAQALAQVERLREVLGQAGPSPSRRSS
jgi:DNA repair exonuclease SbcCD ATPase subunit